MDKFRVAYNWNGNYGKILSSVFKCSQFFVMNVSRVVRRSQACCVRLWD